MTQLLILTTTLILFNSDRFSLSKEHTIYMCEYISMCIWHLEVEQIDSLWSLCYVVGTKIHPCVYIKPVLLTTVINMQWVLFSSMSSQNKNIFFLSVCPRQFEDFHISSNKIHLACCVQICASATIPTYVCRSSLWTQTKWVTV